MNYKKADEKTRTAFFVAFIQSEKGGMRRRSKWKVKESNTIKRKENKR